MMYIQLALSALLFNEVAAACTGCDECVAIPGNPHNALDNHCAPCAAGQAWWPCDRADLCQCQGQNDGVQPSTASPVTCVAIPGNRQNASTEHCAPCAQGQTWWPCNVDGLCDCSDGRDQSTTASPVTSEQNTTAPVTTAPATTGPATTAPVTTAPATTAPVTTAPSTTEEASQDEPCSTTNAPTTEAIVTTNAPTTTDIVTTSAPSTSEDDSEATSQGDDSFIDGKKRTAQASVFGDYTTINWNQVICSQDESDAKPYMQANPICATAINMGSGAFQTTDQNNNPGFCVRSTPGAGAAKASSCWKVTCVGGDNPLGVGVSCKHSNPIYLKTVDTNTENSLSLTDDQYTAQCENVSMTTNTPSCRAFDITVQAWDLMVVFASNQGSLAGQPAGLNGIVPVEYEEVDCNDPVVEAAIQSSHCGLPAQLII